MSIYFDPQEEAEIRAEIRRRAYQRRETFIKDFEEEYKDPTPDFVAEEGESPRDQFARFMEGPNHDDPRFQEPEPEPEPDLGDVLREAFDRIRHE